MRSLCSCSCVFRTPHQPENGRTSLQRIYFPRVHEPGAFSSQSGLLGSSLQKRALTDKQLNTPISYFLLGSRRGCLAVTDSAGLDSETSCASTSQGTLPRYPREPPVSYVTGPPPSSTRATVRMRYLSSLFARVFPRGVTPGMSSVGQRVSLLPSGSVIDKGVNR